MTDEQLDLAEIMAMCEAATDGEWRWTVFPKEGIWETVSLCAFDPGDDCSVGQGILFHHAAWAITEGDKQFITQSRTLIPRLVARVQELEAENDSLLKLVEDFTIDPRELTEGEQDFAESIPDALIEELRGES